VGFLNAAQYFDSTYSSRGIFSATPDIMISNQLLVSVEDATMLFNFFAYANRWLLGFKEFSIEAA
jgi:hypothetical protein